MIKLKKINSLTLIFLVFLSSIASADENLFGYVRGSETLPKGSSEIYEILTYRADKGAGTYEAVDSSTEYEYGKTDHFSIGASLLAQAVHSKNLLIDAYIPKDIDQSLTAAGLELFLKYNYLSAAKDDFGVSSRFSLEQRFLDPHSGQKKNMTSAELELLIQKYYLEGEVILVGNLALESTYSDRYNVEDLPAGFEWPTHPEMEIELKVGTGISYRFMPKYFIGLESVFQTEYETEVGQERWSTFAGPSFHYGSERWWTTITWFAQLRGGNSTFPEQNDKNLHLVEKTKNELRLKIGYNF